MGVFSVGVAAPHITSGKLKALAVVSEHRVPSMPDVPTLTEAGYREANVVPWYGFVVHGATPRPVAQRINNAINQALESPEVQERLRGLATEPQPPRSLEQIAAVLRSDFEKYRQVIQAGGITAE
jgi:tripartite-type tricarboxylate transporter receptor subunit TctC